MSLSYYFILIRENIFANIYRHSKLIAFFLMAKDIVLREVAVFKIPVLFVRKKLYEKSDQANPGMGCIKKIFFAGTLGFSATGRNPDCRCQES